ncbi:MAG: hypothetical protein V4561_02730 [Bacteroidota bacterium]
MDKTKLTPELLQRFKQLMSDSIPDFKKNLAELCFTTGGDIPPDITDEEAAELQLKLTDAMLDILNDYKKTTQL